MTEFVLKVIPKSPGIYAMYDRNDDVAYVGISKNIRSRIDQHLNRRDSSVTTSVSATSLNPDKIAKVCWWLHQSFEDISCREAGELTAFEILNPSLRSKGVVTERAKELLNDNKFRSDMEHLFKGEPTGSFVPKTLDNLVLMVLDLQERVESLEDKLQ